jgi:hypothetical protein
VHGHLVLLLLLLLLFLTQLPAQIISRLAACRSTLLASQGNQAAAAAAAAAACALLPSCALQGQSQVTPVLYQQPPHAGSAMQPPAYT